MLKVINRDALRSKSSNWLQQDFLSILGAVLEIFQTEETL